MKKLTALAAALMLGTAAFAAMDGAKEGKKDKAACCCKECKEACGKECKDMANKDGACKHGVCKEKADKDTKAPEKKG